MYACLYAGPQKYSIKLHLDYGDLKYNHAFGDLFNQCFESIQYNAAIEITGGIWMVS